jgi:HEAT repeat protein
VLLFEDLILITVWLLAAVVIVNLVFLVFVFYRRWARTKYYRTKDEAKERYRRAVADFMALSVGVEPTAQLLRDARSEAEKDGVLDLLREGLAALAAPRHVSSSSGMRTPSSAGRIASSSGRVQSGTGRITSPTIVVGQALERVSELVFALGYVDGWARTAFGRARTPELVKRSLNKEKTPVSTEVRASALNRFRRLRIFCVPRALAVDKLGSLAADYGQVFMAEALHDPATEVRSVAVAAMGRARHPAAIPLLLEELRKALEEGNDVSLRSTKAALCSYQMSDLELFVPYVRHPNRRLRFFVVDTMREISSRAGRSMQLTRRGFPDELCALLLEHSVNDVFADVRARSAALVAQFRDAQAADALRKLLKDENEFVRLHTVRVCGDRYYGDLIPDILRCLSDSKWRVREAAVGTLRAFGMAGLNELFRYFAATSDRYESEQIAEEIQRTGMIEQLVTALASGGEASRLADAVCRKMATMGKTSLLLNAVAARIPQEARILLMDALMVAPTAKYMSILETLAETDGGPVGDKARDLLRQAVSRSGQMSSTPSSGRGFPSGSGSSGRGFPSRG